MGTVRSADAVVTVTLLLFWVRVVAYYVTGAYVSATVLALPLPALLCRLPLPAFTLLITRCSPDLPYRYPHLFFVLTVTVTTVTLLMLLDYLRHRFRYDYAVTTFVTVLCSPVVIHPALFFS